MMSYLIYVRKDTAFWRKWNGRFSKVAAVPLNVDRVSDDFEIAHVALLTML